MSLAHRLRCIVDAMPADGTVTLSVAWLKGLLAAEGDSLGMDRLLTLEEAGDIVGRSPSTVRTWLNTGRLDGFKLNARSWRIRESALRSFIERQEAGGHEPPTIRNSELADIGDWRQHMPPDKGAA